MGERIARYAMIGSLCAMMLTITQTAVNTAAYVRRMPKIEYVEVSREKETATTTAAESLPVNAPLFPDGSSPTTDEDLP